MEKTWRWFGRNDKVSLSDLRQIGVEGIVTALHHIPNGEVWPLEEILDYKKYIEDAGLKWSVVESLPVSEVIKYGGEERDRLIDNYILSLENLGKAGITTVCYNFMPVIDWIRTDLNFQLPDGSSTLFFDLVRFAYFDLYILHRKNADKDYSPEVLEQVEALASRITQSEIDGLIDTIIVKTQGFINGNIKEGDQNPVAIFKRLLALYEGIDKDALRRNLQYFLERIMPVCEQYKINMCIHPDDPPYQMLGLPRIVTDTEDIQWIFDAVDNQRNGLTFCAGSLSAGSHNDVPGMAEKFAARTHFVHLRSTDVHANGDFIEASHLEGRGRLIELVKIFETINPNVPMRVDHGRLMLDDADKGYNPGYSFHGRMFALAQMDGVMAAVKHGFLTLSILIFSLFTQNIQAQSNFTFKKGSDLHISFSKSESEVVQTALEIFSRDYQQVFQGKVNTHDNPNVFIGTIGENAQSETLVNQNDIQDIQSRSEGFLILVRDGKLIIIGSDKRGTAYGILEISRMMGVSPWEWWADSPITPKEKLVLKNGFRMLQSPSVKHRGIFINDEDWGLTPWSYKNFEPSDIKGQIGPKTHARIFELLLRLRANTFWPAMHDCSVAFYLTPGNRQLADKYGVYVGTSHCEPMMRSSNTEWKIAGTGDYNYLTNRENILKFWEQRTTELGGSDNIYTLGIRGVHDGKMEGANTLQEQKDAITQILKDQREMIKRIVNPDVEKVSQVFIPYKEVLDVYNMGLDVPEDVTLMWTDDNYGYIRHFPDSIECSRKGGNGIYTHVSYWGRPHDYLWLSTTYPALLQSQMRLAYDKGAKDMWIINVGDIKPAEYLLELLMDMAWNIDAISGDIQGIDHHLKAWLAREFGKKYSDELLAVMNEYYRLAYIRKPEFMGNTRTEERDPAYKIVSDLPWSEQEIAQRIVDYQKIEREVKKISTRIPADKKDAWFQLIEYPVRAAAQMNYKHLYGQLARHGKVDWSLSDAAYAEIEALTKQYNELACGKWKYMMDFRPRDLAVYQRLPHEQAIKPMKVFVKPLIHFNGADYKSYQGTKPVHTGMGYQRGAISLAPNTAVMYSFKTSDTNSIRVEVALAPNHPVAGKTIRFAISLNGSPEEIINYRTEGRSEEWKLNVLRNQAIRSISFKPDSGRLHKLTIRAVDEGVVLDEVKILKE